MNLLEFHPLGDRLGARAPEEKFNDEVYRSIPSLDSLALSAMRASNKLSQEARSALFFGNTNESISVRALKVEVAMLQKQHQESIRPDVDYFASVRRAQRKDYEEKDADVWIRPSGPSSP